MKICFIAPSGYGKTTAVNYLENEYNAKNIKIADFLYEVETYIYNRMGINIKDCQDGELLQFLGKKVRKIDPNFLTDEFNYKVKNSECNLILNDDCRPADYLELKNLGFIFVKIISFSHDRDDITAIDKKNPLEWQSDIDTDYVVENLGSLEEYYKNLDRLMEEIKNDRQVLCYTGTKSL